MTAIKLIVGLGNPGPEYAQTRHNAGAWFVEQLASDHHVSLRSEAKFSGASAQVNINNHDCRLLIPSTYMNASGQSVLSLAHFYKILPQEMLVVHDDLDLDAGTIRLKQSGGHGGHNGLRDIINRLGSKDFNRLRIGIGHPGDRKQVVDFVLHKPGKSDRKAIDNAIEDAMRVMDFIASGDLQKAMLNLHSTD